MSYPNWKLGEKKAIKEAEPKFAKAQSDIQSKLGSEWTVDVDWETIGKITEGNSYRENAGKNVVENYVVDLYTNDIAKFDADASAALNKLAGVGNKKIIITMAPAGGSFDTASRMNIEIAQGQVKITWAADWFGYNHGQDYVHQKVLATPNSSAMPAIPGTWTLAEIKSVTAAQKKVDDALHKLRAKAGNEWQINIDWAKFAEHSAGSSYRADSGDMVSNKLVAGFANNDADKFDADVASALNDAVGSAKKVNFTMGPKTGTYEISSRLNIKVDKTNGVTLEWNADWAGYDYGSDYLNQWVLKNC